MNKNILIGIERSEYAYSIYLKNKLYHQALRVYKANKVIYELLIEYLYESKTDKRELVLEYIFHLEDWFEQFIEHKNQLNPKLEDEFVFQKLKNSINYPKNFIELIIK